MPRIHPAFPLLAAVLVAGTLGVSVGTAQQQEGDAARQARREMLIERERADQESLERRTREADLATERRQAQAEGGAARAAANDPYGPTISVNFAGGSLDAYIVQLIAAAAPEPTNILVRGDARTIEISPAELRDISLFSALQLVSGDYRGADGRDHRVSTMSLGAQGESAAAFLVEVRSERPSSGGFSGPREVLVLSIREMTTPLPGDPPEVVVNAETILTALETAIAIAGDEGVTSEMKYHPESGLLILAGTGNSLSAADRVVKQIWEDVQQRRLRAREIQQVQGLTNPDALQEQLADAKAEAQLAAVRTESAMQQRRALQERLLEAQERYQQGAQSADEMRQAELEVMQAEAMMQEHQIHADRANERVARAAEALDRAKAIAAGGGAESELAALRQENAMLRDRLAMMEAQIAELRERLESDEQNRQAR
jgi:hypothetical protein